MIKVLITDDHPVVRRGIRQILEDEDKISLIHEAGNGKELIDKLNENVYDVRYIASRKKRAGSDKSD
jgi:YesN/AraC family two-component response regulator